ncbi:MAG TPA: radical SAM protein [Chlorobaculum parvum]|uniref:Radical SAM protein n=1 Tax=Chlorobaculum parvum TaxID=274539 RepID=A0A7C5HIL7_9CHLB|nr:radical SAM protein [Chlorobaculum parvum]
MLVVTTACNLDCAYCYEGGAGGGGVMELETAIKAIELAASGGAPFHVQLTGGEPLLAGELVFRILEYIRNNNLPATTAIQTNGVLLDQELTRRLHSFGTAVGVSVDGLPAIQEVLRGEGAATWKALAMLDSEQVPFSVTSVLSSRNTRELSTLGMALHSMPMASAIGLDLLVRKGSALEKGDVQPPDAVTIRSGVTRLLATLDVLNAQRSRPLILRERQTVLKALRRDETRPYCQACTGSSLAVTPRGELYPCTQTLGDARFHLGTLDDPHLSMTTLLDGRLPVREECAGCGLQGCCPGDCPSRLHYNGADGAGLICDLYRTIYDYCLYKGEIPS